MLYYITSNQDKINNAKRVLQQYDIEIKTKDIPFLEIQSDSQNEIVMHKAKQAFAILKKPLVVNDAGWYITALKGFPGVYMKYMNQWLTSEDFLNLIKPYRNREIVLKEANCYIDEKQTKVFIQEYKGRVLHEPRGKGCPSDRIVSFTADGKSFAEQNSEGLIFTENKVNIWDDFAVWYQRYLSLHT